MADPVLEARGLVKSFGALRATNDVSLTLKPGEIHALIGPNGAGKSTLIQLLCGGLRADQGRVFLGGRDVSRCDAPARARAGLGRSFQVSALAMERSALENVLLGTFAARGALARIWRPALAKGAGRTAAEAALARVGLADLAHRRTATLSHGQRRQLEVAVALSMAPKAFLMDEPMAGLGAEGSKAMTGFLDGLRAEAPILLVEHDMDAVFALADRISVLVEGAVIASGSADAIRRDPRVRAAYLGADHP